MTMEQIYLYDNINSGVYSAFYVMGKGASFPGGKAAGA